EPDQFGFMEAQFLGLFQLGAELLDFDHIGEAQVAGAVDKRKRSGGFGELLPDELEHQELVKIGVEQRPRNRVQLPVVVMGASREVDDHDVITLPHSERSSETGPIAPVGCSASATSPEETSPSALRGYADSFAHCCFGSARTASELFVRRMHGSAGAFSAQAILGSRPSVLGRA